MGLNTILKHRLARACLCHKLLSAYMPWNKLKSHCHSHSHITYGGKLHRFSYDINWSLTCTRSGYNLVAIVHFTGMQQCWAVEDMPVSFDVMAVWDTRANFFLGPNVEKAGMSNVGRQVSEVCCDTPISIKRPTQWHAAIRYIAGRL